MSLDRFIRDYEAGAIIFEEGEPGHEMYIVKDGEISIETTIQSEGKNIVKYLGGIYPGEFFGEMAIIGGEIRSARAVAKLSTQLVALNKNRFYELIENSPEFAIKIVRKLSDRLKEANQRMKDYLSMRKKSSILSTLQELSDKEGQGIISLDSICEGILISQTELKPILKQLVEIGLIRLDKNTVIISDQEELRKFLKLLTLLERSE